MTQITTKVHAALVALLGISTSLSGQTIKPVYSGAVQDFVVIDHPSWFQGPVDDGFGLPFPPPHTIPPIEMPTPNAGAIGRLMTGNVLIHDANTGITVEVPGMLPDDSSSGSVTGFHGIDGGGEGGGGWRMFSNLTPVADPSLYPWRVNAKAILRFEVNGNESWSRCSATLLDGEVALLAGHCVYSQTKGYATDIYIIPGWDGVGATLPPSATLNPYGWMHGTYFLVGSDWVHEGNKDFDMGAVVLTRAAGILTGWHGRSWGGSCQDSLGRTYTNVSYPNSDNVDCVGLSVDGGLIMHEWGGTLDSCVGNLLQLDFSAPGCFTETWPGMSGSSAVFQVGQDYFAHAVNSHKSNGNWARYCKMWQGFDTALILAINQVARGIVLDIQLLACDGSKTKILPGGSLDMTHISVNASNFDPTSQTYTFTWYLSDNDSITTADTPLTTRSVIWDHDAMGAATFSSPMVQIPMNTPPGTYWLGVIYDSGTDGSPENNISTLWDAYKLIVGGGIGS